MKDFGVVIQSSKKRKRNRNRKRELHQKSHQRVFTLVIKNSFRETILGLHVSYDVHVKVDIGFFCLQNWDQIILRQSFFVSAFVKKSLEERRKKKKKIKVSTTKERKRKKEKERK